jgi:hypothetical protein
LKGAFKRKVYSSSASFDVTISVEASIAFLDSTVVLIFQPSSFHEESQRFSE